jgi:uncharacterized heparinase superfamily protein
MLVKAYEARRIQPDALIGEVLAKAVPALQGVMMGDGALSSWQGGLPLCKVDMDAILLGSGVRARPMRQARDWGYQRISVGDTIIVMDAAPPPVSRLVETGCASTLAVEISDAKHRLVVNCGGARAGGAGMTPVLAQGLRTTAAHSTLTLSDSNSTSVHADGSLGKGVEEVELDRQEAEIGSRIEASHDGYARRYGFVHRRSMSVGPDGREIRGDDVLVPAQVRRKGQAATFAVRFHLGPDVEVSPTADGNGALLRISEGALWQFRSHGGALVIDDSLWVDGNGRIRATQQLVISGEVRILPAAVAHGNLTVRVTENQQASQPGPFGRGQTVVTQQSTVEAGEAQTRMNLFAPGAKLGEIIDAVNALTPNYKGSVIIPGAGHWTQQEFPDEFNAAMMGFLKTL